jgi:EAL domain-containing protein (putative c-di-GMP-specific phosphodiesterase class I)
MELGAVPRLMGAEALLRWTHPEHGPVPPDRFIALAEETGVIIDLGRFVMDKATRAVTAWNSGRAEPLSMAVNLSPRQFLRHDIVGETAQIMMQNGCKPEWLELEITENLMLVDDPDILEKLDRLRALGLSVAIDDFGTGHSALGYLNRFSVDVLKIDRSFVIDMEKESRKRALVRAFISMADALDMVTVAEGVENAEQAQILQGMGCTIGQGYLFGRPQPLDDFAKNFGL